MGRGMAEVCVFSWILIALEIVIEVSWDVPGNDGEDS